MKKDKSVMGRREFLVAAGAASTTALASKKLAGLIGPGAANAGESSTGASKASDSKCVVIYSSMTGNTEKVARAIQKALEQAAGNCDIFPIKEANPKKLAGYELVALGYPLMGPRLKMDVENFINDLRYVGGKHVFLFSTSDSGSNNHSVAIPELRKHDMVWIGSKSWRGSVYGPLGDPTPSRSDGHPDKADLQDAANYAKEMWEMSKKIYAGDESLIPGDLVQQVARTAGGFGSSPGGAPGASAGGPMPEGAAAGGAPPGDAPAGGGMPGGGGGLHPDLIGLENDTNEQLMKRIHFKLIYEQDKCIYPKCQRCMDFCPVWGIDMTVEPRIIGEPCMMCMMCDQVCPTGAIYVDPAQMEWQREVENYGPDVKQVYQVYNKHPRFIVGYGRPYGIDPYTQEDRGDGSQID